VRDFEQLWAIWMLAAIGGDALSYRRLLEELAPYLRDFVGRRLRIYGRSQDDTEDIVQETLLAVHLKKHTWDGRRPIVPWVRAIALHKTIDALRRHGHRINVPIDDVADDLPVESVEPQLRTSEIERFISTLRGRQKDVVRAIALDGLTIKEAGRRLQMSEGAVRVALHRGFAALAAAYKEIGS
jgi:RNA polymerase sigma-70 factor, ECF subfamily